MSTMQAMTISSYGGTEVLDYRELPRPVAGDDQLVIRVHAAGVNPVDWKIRNGDRKDKLDLTFPYTPGIDFSGIVRAAGGRPGSPGDPPDLGCAGPKSRRDVSAPSRERFLRSRLNRDGSSLSRLPSTRYRVSATTTTSSGTKWICLPAHRRNTAPED